MQGKTKKWLLGTGAVAAIGVLGVGGTLLAVSPDDYRPALLAQAGAAGATLALKEPLRWQLWPPGVQVRGVTLTDKTSGAALLDAHAASASLDLVSLLRFSPALSELRLDKARLIWQHTDAGSNWSQVIAWWQQQPESRLALRIESGELAIVRGEYSDSLDIARLVVAAPGTDGARAVQAALRLSYQQAGDNLLVEPVLTARLATQDGVVSLHDLALSGELAGTMFPGALRFALTGDATLKNGELAMPVWQASGDYRRIGMASAEAWTAKGSLVLAREGLTATPVELRIGAADRPVLTLQGQLALRPEGEALRLTWRDGHLQFGAIDMQALTMQGAWVNGELHMDIVSARQEAGQIDLPFVLRRDGGEPTLQLRPAVTNVPLGLWLALVGYGEGGSGLLDVTGDMEMQGFSADAWAQSLQGRLTLTLRDAALPATDINQSLHERLQSYQSFLPPLAAPAASAIDFKRLRLHNVMTGPHVDSLLEADTGRATLEAEGRYDRAARLLAYRGVLDLRPGTFAAAERTLELPLTCGSDLAATGLSFLEALSADCRVEEKAQKALLAQALRQRFLAP